KPRICAFKPARKPITEGDGGGAPDNGRPFFIDPGPEPAGKIPRTSFRQACWLARARRGEERMELPDRARLEDIKPRLASQPHASGLATIRDHRRMRLSSIQATLHR